MTQTPVRTPHPRTLRAETTGHRTTVAVGDDVQRLVSNPRFAARALANYAGLDIVVPNDASPGMAANR